MKIPATKERPRLSKELIKELGKLEKANQIRDYVSRFIIGTCYVYSQEGVKAFSAPRDKDILCDYLEDLGQTEGVIVDLLPVAICLFAKERIYSFQPSY